MLKILGITEVEWFRTKNQKRQNFDDLDNEKTREDDVNKISKSF
jgi:hypothetical protein